MSSAIGGTAPVVIGGEVMISSIGFSADTALPSATELGAAQVNALADELLETLSSAANYPDAPAELTFAFLNGVDAAALTPIERDSLLLEQAADRRLTGLLDQLVNAIQSRKAKLLVKGQSMFTLLPKPGIKSFAEERSRDSGKTFGGAVRELRAAQTLATMPSAQTALDEGTMSTGHVEVLARALDTDKRNDAHALTADEQDYVTNLATGRTESDFSTVLQQFLARRNPLAADAAFEETRRRRFFNIAYTPHGAHFKGFIDQVAAQTLRQALEAAADRPTANDDRSLTQRSADALFEVAQAALNAGKLKTSANVRPHVSLIMTEATFAQATKELNRRKVLTAMAQSGTPPATAATTINPPLGVAPTNKEPANAQSDSPSTTYPAPPITPSLLDPVAVAPAQYLDGTAVPLTELDQILCDCAITRVVLTAEGLVTNLGRTARIYTNEHRHAVIARDRTCRFNGCTTPPTRCEIHHIAWWERDQGETSLTNAVLVCKRHHTEIHEGKLTVVKDHAGLPTIVIAGPPIPAPSLAAHTLITQSGNQVISDAQLPLVSDTGTGTGTESETQERFKVKENSDQNLVARDPVAFGSSATHTGRLLPRLGSTQPSLDPVSSSQRNYDAEPARDSQPVAQLPSHEQHRIPNGLGPAPPNHRSSKPKSRPEATPLHRSSSSHSPPVLFEL